MTASKLVLAIGVVMLFLVAFGVDFSAKFDEFSFALALCFGSHLLP